MQWIGLKQALLLTMALALVTGTQSDGGCFDDLLICEGITYRRDPANNCEFPVECPTPPQA